MPAAIGRGRRGGRVRGHCSTPRWSPAGSPGPDAGSTLAAADRDYTPAAGQGHLPRPGAAAARRRWSWRRPKEDTSRFIRLTGVGRNPDGTGRAFIEDVASKQEYEIELTRKGGEPDRRGGEVLLLINRIKKAYAPEAVLDISEASSGTARKFRVVGLDGDALILAEAKRAPAPRSRRQPAAEGGWAAAVQPPPAAAVLGGFAAVVAPAETVFVWRHGESLNQVKALSREEARRRSSGRPPARRARPGDGPDRPRRRTAAAGRQRRRDRDV